MSRMNAKRNNPRPRNFGGGEGPRESAEKRLRRAVLSCLLWEGTFYETGDGVARRIYELSTDVPAATVAALAVEARLEHNLRHVPLYLLALVARRLSGCSVLSDALAQTVRRADEMAEFLALYAHQCQVGTDQLKSVMTAQVKKGLARAFGRFDAYQLAKYDRAGPVRLRDVMFLTHPRPRDDEQAENWRRLVEGSLAAPDTWEVALSAGADKRATFERLLREERLGYLALLRNLRNMCDAGVDRDLIRSSLLARKGARHVMPFRYVAAARACPQMEPDVDRAMQFALAESPQWEGDTVVLVDVSGSMHQALSARSDMTRMDAACALAALVPQRDRRVFSFSNRLVEVPNRSGMALVDAVQNSQHNGGTYLGAAVREICAKAPHDRLVVVTDEQSHDRVPSPTARMSWLINVAPYENGCGYESGWNRVNGWSEGVLKYIAAVDAERA